MPFLDKPLDRASRPVHPHAVVGPRSYHSCTGLMARQLQEISARRHLDHARSTLSSSRLEGSVFRAEWTAMPMVAATLNWCCCCHCCVVFQVHFRRTSRGMQRRF